MTEWFERWLGDDYLRLYPHREHEDAATLTALVARLFGRDELAAIVLNAGLRVVRQFGDYEGAPHANAAPRTILMAETS